MRFRLKQRHMIDFLFPVALFFVFALSALTVILLATQISLNYTARTSLSYISEKVHQNDSRQSISLGTFDGYDSLVLKHQKGGETYYTYIYSCQDELKELFLKEGAKAGASAGQTILKVQDFSMEEVTDGLFSIRCTDESGRTASTLVGVHSN